MFKQANTRKHVSEQSCSSVRVFLSILAHSAYLAQFFLFHWDKKDILIEHANTIKHFSGFSWIFG